MADASTPLLARPTSTEDVSSDRAFAEEDRLLIPKSQLNKQAKHHRWRELGLFIWAMAATVIALVVSVVYSESSSGSEDGYPVPHGKRNLIFMVSDGMGPSSLSLTRSYAQYDGALPLDDDPLILDSHLVGQSRTKSSSSLITDSAAGATAFSCGQKTYNGAISVLPDGIPCGTVLEAAKQAGYMTGLVVTTRITDATPACFGSHVRTRGEEDRIAEQLLGDYPLGQNVDLMLGAGRCHFLSNDTEGSCRADAKDLITQAKENGFNYIDNRQDFDNLRSSSSIKLPLLGLFADHDIPFEIDRRQEDERYPSLAEMAQTAMLALKSATMKSDKGFFLMIEGSRIDHAGHANDPAAQVHEILAYDSAFETVLDFLDEDDVPGLMVATSDHETGGLAIGRQLHPYEYPPYLWRPSTLANVTHSVEWVTRDYARYLSKHDSKVNTGSMSPEILMRERETYLRDTLLTSLGIRDPSTAELDLLINRPQVAAYTFADMVSRRAQIGWSTHGHTAADVNIFASNSKTARKLQGSVENTEVGMFLQQYLSVDTDAVTRRLNTGDHGWMKGTMHGKDEPGHPFQDGMMHDFQD